MAVMQQQVDQAEEVKVIQIVHLVLQELVQQEILLLQLRLKETLVEMEFNLLLLDAHKLLAVGGEASDCIQEPDYYQKNMALYALRNGVPLSTHAAGDEGPWRG